MEFIIYTVIFIFLLIPLTLGIALLLKAVKFLITTLSELKKDNSVNVEKED